MLSQMREVAFSTAGWEKLDDLYVSFLRAVGAPSWHGHNLDAVLESITRGSINAIDPPYRIRISGIRDTPAECKELLDSFIALLEEAKAEGTPIEVVLD